MNRALDMISPKPMVDGLLKSFGEFRNGCDEKMRTITRHVLYRKLVNMGNYHEDTPILNLILSGC